MTLKRLWDTTEKKMVFAKGPTGHDCQVWTDEEGSKLYIYDMAQWLEYTPSVSNDGKVYGPQWKAVDGDDEVGFYDTNVPTDLYVWESGDEVSYVFKDWDGTVLKEGKVKEGTKPTAPADPTRTGYTFAGWNPAVAKITKKTIYTATYTPIPYTITFVDEDGTTVLDEQTCDYGTMPVYAGETPTKEATAQYTYTFSGWTPELATVTGDATYTATYNATINQYTVTITVDPEGAGTLTSYSETVDYGTIIYEDGAVLTIGEIEIEATPEEGYAFNGYSLNGGQIPETVTEDLAITAQFESTVIPVTAVTIEEGTTVTTEINSNVTFSLDVTPGNANDVSTLSATISDDTKCSVSIFYQEGNGVRCMIIGLAEGTADVTIYCSGVSQGVIGVTVTAPL